MNYITHLNQWFHFLEQDSKVRPTHISLYMALFNAWNKQRFSESIFITRLDLMKMSKIGSKTTYCSCMLDLHRWGWIYYTPSNSIYAKSEVKMFDWSQKKADKKEPANAKNEYKSGTTKWTSPEPLVGHPLQTSTKSNKPFINQTKQEKNSVPSFKSKYHEPL